MTMPEFNKIALITGASRGIGLAIARQLLSSGYYVVATYFHNLTSELLELEIEYSNFLTLHQLDITSSESCNLLFDLMAVKQLMPGVLINNAGITSDSFFSKMTKLEWTDVINTNLSSLYNITHSVYKKMIEEEYGRIINLSSVNAEKGQCGQANYCASKAGIIGFTKALALEGARYGITVNTVSPGYTETDMVIAMKKEVQDKIKAMIPLKRFSSPDEIANLVGFLASKDAGYITGANYAINGGLDLN